MPKRVLSEITNTMPKRVLSEITTTAAAESPKKRGRPCKKLEPLPNEIMKALNIPNAYVEKQQAQVQEKVLLNILLAGMSDVAAIPEVSEGSPPVKRKGGWPKGKPRKPKSPSPEVSEEPKSKEAESETDPWVLVNAADPYMYGLGFDGQWSKTWLVARSPRSLNQDKRVINLIRKYLTNCKKINESALDEKLAWKLEEIGVFQSKRCFSEAWKLKRLSKLTAEEREKIDYGLMSEEDRAEHQRSQGRVYRGKYSLP